MSKASFVSRFLAKNLRLRLRRRSGGYIVIDLCDDSIRLPNGKTIPRSRIINIDTERKEIHYIDDDGSIKVVRYG